VQVDSSAPSECVLEANKISGEAVFRVFWCRFAFTDSFSVSSHSRSDVPTQSSVHSEQTESGTSTSEILHDSKMIQPHKELQSIISQLEEENRCSELINYLMTMSLAHPLVG